MADDWCCKGTDPSCDGPQECANRAALLIEAQQAEIERLRAAATAERALADQLAEATKGLRQAAIIGVYRPSEELAAFHRALAAHKEARRG